jgi:hypothetical protein
MARHNFLNLSALGLAALLGTAAHAESFTLQPHLGGGVQDYELSFADVITISGNGFRARDGFTIGDHLSFASAGLTASRGQFFADVSGQWSNTGKDQGQIFQGSQTGSGFTNSLGHNHLFDARFDRQELNATLGWGVTPNFSAYIGYKQATLNLTQARTPSLSPPPIFGDVLQVGNYIMDFSYHGFFLGASYAVPVRTWGTLSVQSSVARLNASFKQHFEGNVLLFTSSGFTSLNPAFMTSRVGGRSTGLNVGISWTGNFGVVSTRLQKLTYTIGLDESQYKFDAPDVTDGNFEEKSTRARFDLRYRFDL